MMLLHFLLTLILAAFLLGAVGRLVQALDDAMIDNQHYMARRRVLVAWAWVVLCACALVGWLVYLARWA